MLYWKSILPLREIFFINRTLGVRSNTPEYALIKVPSQIMKNLKIALLERLKGRNDIAKKLVISLAIMAILPLGIADATEEVNETKIKLDTNSHELLVLDDSKVEIIPGESKIEREAREKAEAEAKAKAEELAKIKVSAESANTVSTYSTKIYNDPANFDEIYQRAQAVYGVDWRLLKAVHYVETGCSGSTSKSSYAGAVGPMQFLPSTWRAYGVDGNGDGQADITNVEDAIFAAARYLSACGYPDVKRALWGYNPSTSYYYKVVELATSLGF